MKGCRPLSDPEVALVLEALNQGHFKRRNQALFLLGLRSGFRISELLSLRWRDIIQNGRIADHVSVERKHMKKQTEGRTVALHPQAREALLSLHISFAVIHSESHVFESRQGGPMDRQSAWKMLKKAYAVCGLTGKLGTHSMRKTFAKKVHARLGNDLMKTQKALGHRSVNSTVSYLSFNEEEIDDAILKS